MPVLCRHYIRAPERLGSGVGLLYAMNTAGAFCGCFLAGFVMIVSLGVWQSVCCAAAINVCNAIAAWVLARGSTLEPRNEHAAPPPDAVVSTVKNVAPAAMPLSGFVLACATLTGFASLAYEVLWTRTLVFFLHSSVYSFPTMLTTFLGGTAIGSLIYSKVLAGWPRPRVLLGACQVAIGAAALATMGAFFKLDIVMGWFGARFGNGWAAFVASGFLASSVILLVPTVLMGISFPLLVRIYTAHFAARGKRIGTSYAANTLGSVAGSVIAGFALVPFLGISRSLTAMAVLSAALGAAILAGRALTRTRLLLPLLAAGVLGATAIFLTAWPWESPLWINSLKLQALQRGGSCLYYKEGLGSTVTVTREPPDFYDSRLYRKISVDGTVVAGTSPMLRTTQKIQAHVPLLLFKAFTGRDARYAFILGLGSGESSHSITLHDIEQLDCAELAPAEVGAMPVFDDINHGLLENPKFSLHLNDARNHLLTTSRVYDVIESDAVHPDIAVNTYTLEYFRIARSRLSEQGIFSSWIPLFNISGENFRIMVKTLHAVFPHIMIWYVPNDRNKHALLIGMKRKLTIDYGILRKELDKEHIRSSLAVVGAASPSTILNGLAADETTLGPLVEASRINSDNHPFLPYMIPRQKLKGEQTMAPCLELLIRAAVPVAPYVHNADEPDSLRALLERRRRSREHAMRGIAAHYDKKIYDPVPHYRAALELAPDDPAILKLLKEAQFNFLFATGNVFSRMGHLDTAAMAFREAIRVNDESAVAYNYLGVALYRSHVLDSAEHYFKKAAAMAPGLPEPRYNLAYLYLGQSSYSRARGELRELLRLDPKFEGTRELKKKLGM
jgi:spermidine synthase